MPDIDYRLYDKSLPIAQKMIDRTTSAHILLDITYNEKGEYKLNYRLLVAGRGLSDYDNLPEVLKHFNEL